MHISTLRLMCLIAAAIWKPLLDIYGTHFSRSITADSPQFAFPLESAETLLKRISFATSLLNDSSPTELARELGAPRCFIPSQGRCTKQQKRLLRDAFLDLPKLASAGAAITGASAERARNDPFSWYFHRNKDEQLVAAVMNAVKVRTLPRDQGGAGYDTAVHCPIENNPICNKGISAYTQVVKTRESIIILCPDIFNASKIHQSLPEQCVPGTGETSFPWTFSTVLFHEMVRIISDGRILDFSYGHIGSTLLRNSKQKPDRRLLSADSYT